MRVTQLRLPDPPKEYVIQFPKLDGGLNLLELDYRLQPGESPEMLNLWWRDGALCCRDGQTRLTGEGSPGAGYSAFGQTFLGHGFFHIGDGLWCGDLSDADAPAGSLTLTKLIEGVPANAGTWFRYGDKLYYKNRGGYYEIGCDPGAEQPFAAAPVTPYSPIIQINSEPATGAGDVYQPENRLCPQKTVWYSAPQGVTVYCLPVGDIDSVDKVEVDGAELAEGSGYTVDLAAGKVNFTSAPPYHNPVVPNTVRITYTKRNPDALASVMDCKYAAVFGGDQSVCVVLAGCPAQPNAYYWCGSHTAMDPGYFPMEQYNLAGDADEAVTGFGKQQDMLVIFKERSVGRAAFAATQAASGRVLLSMPYTAINSRIGCDLPGSVQLIGNNLVFANAEQGVHVILDTSAAYENNIVCISRKVNGSPLGNGLLHMLRGAKEADSFGGENSKVTSFDDENSETGYIFEKNMPQVTSFDDDQRYWIVAGGEVYCWDYTISGMGDPSWFYLTNIPGIAFLRGEDACWHLDGLGRVSILRRNWQDYGGSIPKKYRFAAQHFGSYDRLKDVTRCVFTVRGDTDTVIDVSYGTDYEARKDLTPIRAFNWRLAPRNLAYRFLGVNRFAVTAVRKPGCRHVRHFSMTLSNNGTGMDMAVISAAVYYRFQGRDR